MIKAYTGTDKEELIHLLWLNTPAYFDPSEETDFIEYLDSKVEDYFVVEENSQIIGAGGINYFEDKQEARLSWDVIHPDFQGRGIGRSLTLHRINHVRNKGTVNLLIVRTTQLVYPFYEKLGFVLEKTQKDFWAKGFDLYQMKMAIKN